MAKSKKAPVVGQVPFRIVSKPGDAASGPMSVVFDAQGHEVARSPNGLVGPANGNPATEDADLQADSGLAYMVQCANAIAMAGVKPEGVAQLVESATQAWLCLCMLMKAVPWGSTFDLDAALLNRSLLSLPRAFEANGIKWEPDPYGKNASQK